jgi:hypothetical protein
MIYARLINEIIHSFNHNCLEYFLSNSSIVVERVNLLNDRLYYFIILYKFFDFILRDRWIHHLLNFHSA